MPIPQTLFGRATITELGFSNYFHYSWGNRLCHAITFPQLYFCIFLIIGGIPYAGHYIVGAVCLFYIILYLGMDLLVGGMWTIVFGSAFYAQFFIVQTMGWQLAFKIALGLLAIALIFQLGGHIVYDHKLPAFTAFEAIIITPFFIFYSVLFLLFNYKKSLMAAIEEATPKVAPAGTKHFNFGDTASKPENKKY